jgi:phenylalanyl-tRNA synthetase alpha chain
MSSKNDLIDDLKALERQALDAISGAESPEDLEELRIQYLGRKDGQISGILRGLGSLGPEDRPAVGAEANRVKAQVQDALEARKASLEPTGES